MNFPEILEKKMKVVLFVGSIRPGRMAERVANLIRNYMSQLGGVEIITFGELYRFHFVVISSSSVEENGQPSFIGMSTSH